MGFKTRERGTYFTIFNGKFCQRVDENYEGAKSRVNKIGKTVYEIFHDSFTGKLVKINTQDSEYGKSWIFVFVDDEGNFYNLQLAYSNGMAVALLKMLPNIDVSKPFELSPDQKMVDGKNRSSLFVKQDGQNIKHAYTRENPNGMPDLKKIKVKGNDVWDDTDRLEFLFSMIDTTIRPKLEMPAIQGDNKGIEIESADGEGEDEDPF